MRWFDELVPRSARPEREGWTTPTATRVRRACEQDFAGREDPANGGETIGTVGVRVRDWAALN